MTAPVTRIDAIRYARHERNGQANFTRPVDDHDLPMPLDYFVWAIHRHGHPPLIVDTGFGEAFRWNNAYLGTGQLEAAARSLAAWPSSPWESAAARRPFARDFALSAGRRGWLRR